VKTFVRVGGDHGWIDQTQCGTAQRRTHSCCRTATTTVRSAILPSLSRFSWNECSDRGFSSMQSGAKAQVHRQELWVWTGCEFHACSCTSFIPEVVFLDISSCLFQETEFVVAPGRLPAEYDLCHSLNLAPSLHGLQTPTLFSMNGSEDYLGTFLFPCVFDQRLTWKKPHSFHPLNSR